METLCPPLVGIDMQLFNSWSRIHKLVILFGCVEPGNKIFGSFPVREIRVAERKGSYIGFQARLQGGIGGIQFEERKPKHRQIKISHGGFSNCCLDLPLIPLLATQQSKLSITK